MALSDLTDPVAVHRAIEEFDHSGRDAFLAKYGFGRSRSYFLVADGRIYDSKAIAGAAHGYQHPQVGPLKPADFSGGDPTVRARLQSLGFTVVVTEPSTTPTRPLALFEDYSRREVHDIFAPETNFTPGAGLWGMQGIIEHQPAEFLMFVTFGRKQGDHTFDEGVTADGVLTWQSQPNQTLATPQVKELIAHDSARASVRLFLRTRERDKGGALTPYTYLGKLAYITHDVERERPVWFQWQLIDEWPPPDAVLSRMGLTLTGAAASIPPVVTATTPTLPGLTETEPPAPSFRSGKGTREFRSRKTPDRSVQDAKNRALGLSGELAVVKREEMWLESNGRADLVDQVRHVALLEGDGAGYDVKSFELDGTDKFIEVKTTRGAANTDFFVSANEVEFSQRHAPNYCLYRLFDFEPALGSGRFYAQAGSLLEKSAFHLEAVLFRASVGVSVAVSRQQTGM